MEKFEVLAANVAFLGETFPRGTIITKKKWQVQADAYNEKKAANAPPINIDDIFEHMEARKIIKEVEEKKSVPVSEPTKVKREKR